MNKVHKPRDEQGWTPDRIKRLRGQRTQEEFGKVIRVPKNTVWRWEAGYTRPDADRSQRLSQLAENERRLQNWKLVGSIEILGDIEEGSRQIAKRAKRAFEKRAKTLEG